MSSHDVSKLFPLSLSLSQFIFSFSFPFFFWFGTKYEMRNKRRNQICLMQSIWLFSFLLSIFLLIINSNSSSKIFQKKGQLAWKKKECVFIFWIKRKKKYLNYNNNNNKGGGLVKKGMVGIYIKSCIYRVVCTRKSLLVSFSWLKSKAKMK